MNMRTMDKTLSTILLCVLSLGGGALVLAADHADHHGDDKDKSAATQPAAKKEYTCPMHPEVVRSEPGKCPKCGMKLVEKTSKANKDEPDNHAMHHGHEMN